MAASDSKAPLRTVKRVQFGILSPDEIVSRLIFTLMDILVVFLMTGNLYHIPLKLIPVPVMMKPTEIFLGLKNKYVAGKKTILCSSSPLANIAG